MASNSTLLIERDKWVCHVVVRGGFSIKLAGEAQAKSLRKGVAKARAPNKWQRRIITVPKETSAKRLQQIETVEIAMQHKSNAGTPQLAGSAAGSRAAEAGAFYPRNPKVDVVVWKTIKCSEVKDVIGRRYSTTNLPAHKQVENNCDSFHLTHLMPHPP